MVEPQIVVLDVAGSSPVGHPISPARLVHETDAPRIQPGLTAMVRGRRPWETFGERRNAEQVAVLDALELGLQEPFLEL